MIRMKSNTQQLAIAKKYLGKGGSKFRKFCGLPAGAAWCDAFVTTIFAEADNKSLFCGGSKQTYCPTTIKWCYNNLACIPPYIALPSDIIFFDWEPNNVPNHIGFVRERKDCDSIYTIEGNTSGGIVANRTRNTKYVCGIFRPHFPASYKIGTLEVDGLMGYCTIAMMQRALKVEVDGILGKGTLKALQKWAGVKQDAIWGKGTSKAIQKKLGVTADGYFGKNSVKALQKWCNAQYKSSPAPTPTPAPQTRQDKMVAWAKAIAADNRYHYVKWNSKVEATHTCPICKGRKYNNYFGWNCIGFAYACWHHGGGLSNKCNCGVISNEVGTKMLATKSTAKMLEMARSRIGLKDLQIIYNGGKHIPTSMLKAGDILLQYSGSTYVHTFLYIGNGQMAHAQGSNGKVPNDKQICVQGYPKSGCKIAIRYIGK